MQTSTDHRGQKPPLILDCPDALLRISAVQALTSLSRTELYRRVREDRFPCPVKIGPKISRWRTGDVQAWLRAQTTGGAHA
ncbi:helix-turn-helix transcriptional regulator [Aquabacterium sp. UBA2148]|uniref:helix-turn-helix transcriptional regulator n=1 Tax=Aquabacterium sp. UBA2148 TaxID=1946042 RepID=UPI002579A8E1|nr:AlpA family phage regulatory protein [Aquabacterium sp. UBA2148]